MAEVLALRRDSGRLSIPIAVGAGTVAAGAVVLTIRSGGPARQILGMVDLLTLGLIAATDAKTLIAPNRLVYPALAFALGAAFALGLKVGLDALGGGAVAFAVLLLVALAGRGAMGFGDVKAGAVCGAIVGVRGVLPMLAFTFLAGGAIAAIFLLLGIRHRKDTIAFTPLLAGGVLASLAVFSPYLVT